MFRRYMNWVALPLLVATLVSSPGVQAQTNLDTRLGIAEGFRNPSVMTDTHAGWERLILPWDQIQPSGAGDFSHLGITISDKQLQDELSHGINIVGLFEFTPAWAAANPDAGRRSPPQNLNLPFDDPNNYWGRFVYETVRSYAGRIDDWVLWNEPEFHPGDPGAGGSFTWLGTDEEFAQLIKVGYLAAKKANPNAHVSFPGTSYWIDLLSNRPQFYDRFLTQISKDPDAVGNGFYHDIVSLNLYRAPDDIYRVYTVIKSIQKQHGIDKPVWLTETNAMPSNDTSISCPHSDTPVPTTMEQQAEYAVQAFAMAAAAGYQRFEFYQMVDQNPCTEPAVWGVTRDDGSRRPVSDALRTAITQFAGYTAVHFVPLIRETEDWSPWPDDPTSLMPNWQVYQVAFDKPGNQRVTALWSGDGAGLRVRVHKNGTRAAVIDRAGNSQPVKESQGWWVLDLAGATAHYPEDPGGYHFIGGEPVLLVEDGVAPGAPIAAPALGEPGSVPREFKLFPNPKDGETVAQGQPAEFYVSVRGYEGFSDPLTFTIDHWSTQRFPQSQDPASLPLTVTLPPSVVPGLPATIHIETTGADPGIYYLDLVATGGGITKPIELALVIN
jgi:hypothetical protein